MGLLNGAARRAIAGRRIPRCNQQVIRRQQYSTGKEPASNLPWILSAIVITAGGVWFTTGSPRADPNSHFSNNPQAKKDAVQDSEEEKKKRQAHRRYLDSMAADCPKPEHAGSSVFNHGKAAESNEHKMRMGKFSGKEFDNHISKHTADPGKDFEIIEKKEADDAPK